MDEKPKCTSTAQPFEMNLMTVEQFQVLPERQGLLEEMHWRYARR